MRLVVDTAICSGHGRCYTLAATLVQSDDEGFPVLVEDGKVADTGKALAHRAIASCPEGALRLVDGA